MNKEVFQVTCTITCVWEISRRWEVENPLKTCLRRNEGGGARKLDGKVNIKMELLDKRIAEGWRLVSC